LGRVNVAPFQRGLVPVIQDSEGGAVGRPAREGLRECGERERELDAGSPLAWCTAWCGCWLNSAGDGRGT
jgi:hypothetical protein